MSRRFISKLYDADDQVLSLDTMERLMKEPGTTYGTWFTRQPWRAEINYYDRMWYADLYLISDPIATYADPDIFSLIQQVVDNHGK